MTALRGVLALALAAAAVLVGVSGPSSAGAAAAVCTPSSATPTVAVATETVPLGGTLRFSGTGWCHPTDGGSRVAVKLDLGSYSRLDSTVHANRSIWAIVDADEADGTFTASFVLPDGTAQTSTPAFPTGRHSLQLLTGSLKTGDLVRTVASPEFTVVAAGTTVPDPPSWSHATVTAGTAFAWVEDDLPAGSGGTLRVAGAGWTHPTAGTGSTVAVKLSSDPDGGQYVRTGGDVVQGDPTIWALLSPGRQNIDADGGFEVSLDLPDGLVAGQYLAVSLFSGRFATGDAQRTVTTAPLVVGGVPWEGDDGGSDEVCTPTTAQARVRLADDTVAPGDVLHLTGTGWCNPAGGGSRIGVKIDDGAISHLDSSVHSNRTIWAIVDADDGDGTFSVDVTLPDGTTATSTPALARGEHTLRLLSGSLAAGDTVRTVESAPFVVGAYRPNGTPEPLNAARALRPATRHGVVARRAGRHLRVHLPRTAPGTWAFVTLYAADGSPRYPSTRWWRLGADRRLVVPLRDAGATGHVRVVVQSGEQGHVGELLGWDGVLLPGAGATDPDPDPDPGATDPTDEPTDAVAPPVVPVVQPPLVAPLSPPVVAAPAPAPPVAAYEDLDPHESGRVRGTLADGVLTLTVPTLRPGAQVYAYVYAPGVQVPAGWLVLDDERRAQLDVSAFGGGYLGVTVQDDAGTSLGWVPVALPAAAAGPEAATVEPAVVAATQPVAVTVAAAEEPWLSGTDGLLLAAGALVLASASLLSQRRRPVGSER